jgi:hypothetical protein
VKQENIKYNFIYTLVVADGGFRLEIWTTQYVVNKQGPSTFHCMKLATYTVRKSSP